jgi:hypothetical protein
MIMGIDLRHHMHLLMVRLLRPVPRLSIKSKKNSSSSIVCLIRLSRFPPLYFSKATWTIFLSVDLCRPFFSSWQNPKRTHVQFTLSPGHLFRSNSCSFYSPVVVYHQGWFLILFLRVIYANFLVFFTIFWTIFISFQQNNKCQKQLFPKKQRFLSLSDVFLSD